MFEIRRGKPKATGGDNTSFDHRDKRHDVICSAAVDSDHGGVVRDGHAATSPAPNGALFFVIGKKQPEGANRNGAAHFDRGLKPLMLRGAEVRANRSVWGWLGFAAKLIAR